MAFEGLRQTSFVQFGVALDAMLFAEPLQAGHGLLKERAAAQQGWCFAPWPWPWRAILEGIQGDAGVLQVAGHPSEEAGIGSRQVALALLQEIRDGRPCAQGNSTFVMGEGGTGDTSSAKAAALAFRTRQRFACSSNLWNICTSQ